MAHHVELHEGLDGDAVRVIRGGDVLRAQQPCLLAGVPVELDGCGRREAIRHEHAEDLNKVDRARAVVVRACTTVSALSTDNAHDETYPERAPTRGC